MKNPGLSPISFLKRPLVIYIIKCLIGISVGYAFYISFPTHEFVWIMLSTLLVLTPDQDGATRIAIDRIKTNIIGASTGLLLFVLHHPNLIMLFIGITIVIVLCWTVKVMEAVRTALVAFLIVTVHEECANSWHVAVERLGCVIGGCIIALVVTFVFNWLLKAKQPSAS